MTYRRTYDRNNRQQVAAALRKEIRAARLKMAVDKQLGRETSPQVRLLAGMTMPPLASARHPKGAKSADQGRHLASSNQ